MAELMNDGTNATQSVVTPLFTTDGRHLDRQVAGGLQIRVTGVGPDITSDRVTGITRSHKDHLIHGTITRPVVDREVCICRGRELLKGLFYGIVTIVA